MEVLTKTEANRKRKIALFKQMYNDAISGMGWKEMTEKYGYKNVHTMKTKYYQQVLPFLRSLPEDEQG